MMAVGTATATAPAAREGRAVEDVKWEVTQRTAVNRPRTPPRRTLALRACLAAIDAMAWKALLRATTAHGNDHRVAKWIEHGTCKHHNQNRCNGVVGGGKVTLWNTQTYR